MFLFYEDLHTHSTFSDGKHTIEENIQAAMLAGVQVLGCADHVRFDTTWLPEYIAEINQLRLKYKGQITLKIHIEAKLLDEAGNLDIPLKLPQGIDAILVADHQFPFQKSCYTPNEIKAMLQSGMVNVEELCKSLVNAYCNAMEKYEKVLIAHPFSILPKIGLSENCIAEEDLFRLAKTAVKTQTPIEISERWKCPTRRTLCILRDKGVNIPLSSDAHSKEKVGVYPYIRSFLQTLPFE